MPTPTHGDVARALDGASVASAGVEASALELLALLVGAVRPLMEYRPVGAKADRDDYVATVPCAVLSRVCEAVDRALAGKAPSLASVLHWHYFTGVLCDHDAKTDTATCACAVWRSDPQPSVGEAIQRWVEHVLAEWEHA